ncbi:hotdog domain-containing protein [Notoacmeibacter sp. MSK16QG-6]|uniref:hotdog domain-containing protein n=1 Tax=Notoacmeibacter sp. MSK16QG-6 TaxID=2957982 RepID=UPI00209FD45E|nr:hotdog domain-containing protein [Notoacmeibacter sp. MSK16QG-6]MCP1200423.1 PaaI family thioesterase [Notoacmeibacter sp. MSK16QG-6]
MRNAKDPPRLSVAETADLLPTIFAPWITEMGLQPVAVHDNGADFRLEDNRRLVHAGGVICGQATASAADTASILTLAAHNGRFRMVTTVSFTCQFICALPPGELDIAVTIEANGKRMAYLRVDIRAAGSEKPAVGFVGSFMYLGD